MKGRGLKQLKEMALADSWERHPNYPDYARCTRNYTEKSANGLTLCILDFLRFSGQQAERISVTGRYIDQSKVVTDTLGFAKKIGSGTWIPGSMQPGSADISATIKNKSGVGVSVKIEVKIGKDKMSPAQERYRDQVVNAGGEYWLCHNLDEFISFYNKLLKS
jgi:hypothetical protein